MVSLPNTCFLALYLSQYLTGPCTYQVGRWHVRNHQLFATGKTYASSVGWLTRAIKDDNIHPSATSENAHQHTPTTWLISLVFHIRASHWLPSLSVHGNQTSHSWDTIRPWKFKVKGQGQRDFSLHSIHSNHFLGVSHQGILSTPIPYIPWQSGLPFPKYNLTLKIQSKVKVKGTLVSVTSSWLIFFCFTSIGPTIPKIWQIECSTGGKWIWNFI